MRVAGLIVAVGFALSGCTGSAPDPGVTGSPTGESTPVASDSASPTPTGPAKPERPEAMKRDDAKGAAAAAEYFIELYPYVMATGDTEEFEAMSHRACGFCDDALEQAKRIRTRHETWTGGEIRSVLLETYARDEVTGIYPLDFEVEQSAAQITDADGVTVFEGEDEQATYRVELGWKSGDWVVVEIASGPTP
ncbi:DUF6318 family protein [Promicromonospora panici]|uniref:DUF6318 family protein n=1 Tax=Promicromonospora panici TaxID=2219658 RepID=UPI0024144D5C|nr:DUF6318 family protein [Promicromonospora panici]